MYQGFSNCPIAQLPCTGYQTSVQLYLQLRESKGGTLSLSCGELQWYTVVQEVWFVQHDIVHVQWVFFNDHLPSYMHVWCAHHIHQSQCSSLPVIWVVADLKEQSFLIGLCTTLQLLLLLLGRRYSVARSILSSLKGKEIFVILLKQFVSLNHYSKLMIFCLSTSR